MENLYVEQRDCVRRMNFNTEELGVLVEEVNIHSVKQRTRDEQENLRENVNIYEELKIKKNKKRIKQVSGRWMMCGGEVSVTEPQRSS